MAKKIVSTKIPSQLSWQQLIANIPTETVDIDESGHYNPKKAPSFDEWMKKG